MNSGPSNKTIEVTEGLLMPTALLSIAASSPEWAVIGGIISFFFGKVLKNYSSRDGEIADWINKNKEVFIPKLVNTEKFKDAFLVMYEIHLKERNKEKRKNARNIFLGYAIASKEEREKFELERLLDINNKITIEELKFIQYLLKEISPIQAEYSKIKANETVTRTPEGKSFNWWYEWNFNHRPLTWHLIQNNYNLHNPSSEKAKKTYGYTGLESNISDLMIENERKNSKTYKNLIALLNSLGLFVMTRDDTSGVIGGGSVHDYYNFSDLGNKFIKFLAKKNIL